MAHLTVQPRPTPAERSNDEILVEVDEALSVFAAAIEDWVTPRQAWEVRLRLDQLDRVDDTGDRLVLIFEERDGIAKVAYLTSNGLDVELFHILTFT